MCCYDKRLVNVAAYVIPGKVCEWCGVKGNLFMHMIVYNKHLLLNMHGIDIKVLKNSFFPHAKYYGIYG